MSEPSIAIPAVNIRKLSKSFDGVEVLRDIDLVVNKGEVVSVLGSSGSGKSTMLRCINWLEEPDRGSIHIAGQRSTRLTSSALSILTGYGGRCLTARNPDR